MAETSEPLLQECMKCGTSIDVTDAEPFARMHCPGCGESIRVRRQFDHFEIQEALGSGGMGTVYRAMDHNLHRSVALKLLRKELSSDPEFIRQFEHEAAITALITHPNVVKVYSTGSDRGLFFIAMELVDHGSLDDVMTNDGKVPELKALEVGIQIAQGLLAALKCGLIHRDVKPGNILFADARSSKIVDFGLAVPMDQAGTVGGEIWGTPYYVAPEKLANLPEDFRSDMYSLAASLYHAITGEPPCETEEATINTLLRLKKTLRPIEQVSPAVASETAYVINRALSFEPGERYQSYEDFIEHLEYAHTHVNKREIAAAKAARQAAKGTGESRSAFPWVALGMFVACLVGGAAVYKYRDRILSPKVPVLQETQVVKALSPEEIYDTGRKLLQEGSLEAAGTEFETVRSHANARHPLKDWAALHLGLTHLLRGNRTEAGTILQTLADAGPFSHEPGSAELAKFFVEAGRELAADAPLPITLSVATDAASGNFRAMYPLLWGGKAWSRGEMSKAAPLFRQSPAPSTEGVEPWIAAYHPLAMRLAEEAETFERTSSIWKSALTARDRAEALPKFKSAVDGTALTGWSKALLVNQLEEATKTVAGEKAEQDRLAAEHWAKDVLILQDGRKRTDVLLAKLQFEDALAALRLLQPTSERGRREKALLVKRATWLAEFKASLIQALIRHQYAGPISTRTGQKIDGFVESASSKGVNVKSQFGRSSMDWANVSLASIYTMEQAFVARENDRDTAASRRWQLGIFALFLGKTAEGKALLQQAAQLKPTYAAEMPDALAAFALPAPASSPSGTTPAAF